ncbi:MAG: sortase [Candidatus Saccharibacteria bacterium]|nr:sortase [Candidatus Saccharibacteria bacterium]
MKKLLSLVLLSVLTWVISCPEFLSAADSVSLTGVKNLGETKTITVKVNQPTVVVATVPAKNPATVKQTPSAPKAGQTATPKNVINIGGKTISLEHVNTTTLDAGNHVNKVNKLLYGHNSTSVFGGLKNLKVGQTFTITENGKTSTYKISRIETYEKNGELLQKNQRGSYMNAVYNAIDPSGVEHSLALMTCSGRSLGGGDATHRLVLFVDSI